MTACTNPELGKLLHAYELNILTDDEVEQFERHTLSCDYCHTRLADFANCADLIRHGHRVRSLVEESAHEASVRASAHHTLLQRLWPDTFWLLKPGVIYLAVLILALPAAIGLQHLVRQGDGVRPVQSIRLVPTRSLQASSFDAHSGLDGIISFGVSGAQPGSVYSVVLEDLKGGTLLHVDRFVGFNNLGMADLLLPHSKMVPGDYRLIVRPSNTNEPVVAEYRFRIVE
jgi:hypothetical protein